MDAKDAAEATTAILFDGALMLGAALVFVTIFRRLGLGAHQRVVLAMIGAALGMADDHMGRAGIGQHVGGDVAGMRARAGRVAVLTADGDRTVAGASGKGCDQRRRRADQHVAACAGAADGRYRSAGQG